MIQGQTDQLLNLRLLEEIDADTFAAKSTELRDRAARLKLQAEVLDRGHDETHLPGQAPTLGIAYRGFTEASRNLSTIEYNTATC